MTALAPHITAFFRQRLPLERMASPHTCDSYAYAFRLLFAFASRSLHVPPSALQLENIDAQMVLAFLEDCVLPDQRLAHSQRQAHCDQVVHAFH